MLIYLITSGFFWSPYVVTNTFLPYEVRVLLFNFPYSQHGLHKKTKSLKTKVSSKRLIRVVVSAQCQSLCRPCSPGCSLLSSLLTHWILFTYTLCEPGASVLYRRPRGTLVRARAPALPLHTDDVSRAGPVKSRAGPEFRAVLPVQSLQNKAISVTCRPALCYSPYNR